MENLISCAALYFDKVACCKQLDRRSLTMLMNERQQVPWPDLIKMFNKGIGVVDLIDQRAVAYHLDQKSTIRFYLRKFFDLMDIACANSILFTIYNASK